MLIGEVAGGGSGQGAAVALAGDKFNRQLHPDEIQWVKDNAAEFAEQQGISKDEALGILLRQANRDVDLVHYVALENADDQATKTQAEQFLSKTKDQQYYDSAFDRKVKYFDSDGSFTNTARNAENYLNTEDKELYKEHGIKHSRTDLPSAMKDVVQEIGTAVVDKTKQLTTDCMADKTNCAMDVASGTWRVIKHIPVAVVDTVKELPKSIKDTGANIGQSLAADEDNLSQFYGEDNATAAKLSGRVLSGADAVATVVVAGKAAKATGEVAKTAGSATKKIGEVFLKDARETADEIIVKDLKWTSKQAIDVAKNIALKEQGTPWETYVLKNICKDCTDLNKYKGNFKTFDAFDPKTQRAISAKTLDTSSKSYKTPSQIKSQLKGYVNDVVKFDFETASKAYVDANNGRGFRLIPEMIKTKEIHLAIPKTANVDQLKAIDSVIEYAKQNNVKFIVTKVGAK